MIGFWFVILVIILPMVLVVMSGGNLGALVAGVTGGFVLWLIGLLGYMVFSGPPEYEEPSWEDRHPYGDCWDTYRGYEC